MVINLSINKYVDFTIDIIHSDKKNTDFYAICIKVKDVKQVIAWLTKSQYEELVASIYS